MPRLERMARVLAKNAVPALLVAIAVTATTTDARKTPPEGPIGARRLQDGGGGDDGIACSFSYSYSYSVVMFEGSTADYGADLDVMVPQAAWDSEYTLKITFTMPDDLDDIGEWEGLLGHDSGEQPYPYFNGDGLWFEQQNGPHPRLVRLDMRLFTGGESYTVTFTHGEVAGVDCFTMTIDETGDTVNWCYDFAYGNTPRYAGCGYGLGDESFSGSVTKVTLAGSYSCDSGGVDYDFSYSFSYGYYQGAGWCAGGMDEYKGEFDTVAECFNMCLEAHGTNLVAVDWWVDNDGSCYCQDECACLTDVGNDSIYLMTVPNLDVSYIVAISSARLLLTLPSSVPRSAAARLMQLWRWHSRLRG